MLETIILNPLGENDNVNFFETHLTGPLSSGLVADIYRPPDLSCLVITGL